MLGPLDCRLATVLIQTAAVGAQAVLLLQTAAKQLAACIRLESQASEQALLQRALRALQPFGAERLFVRMQAADIEELAALSSAIASALAQLPSATASPLVDRTLLNPLLLTIVRWILAASCIPCCCMATGRPA
jgi:uncharacterized membrane protein YbhN (UPF0104 family)